jgi:feruloyl esterase
MNTCDRRDGWKPVAIGLALLILAPLLRAQPASPSGSSSPTLDCSAALKFARPGLAIDRVAIDRVERVAAGHPPLADGSGAVDSAAPVVPEHCLVQGRVDPRIGHGGRPFAIGFDLRLPTQWNGRFAFHGGGGMDGRLVPAVGDIHRTLDPSALARGFAVISSDGGRRGAWTDSTFGQDQQARIDYAYNALEKITVLGKQFVTEFYGRPPDWSYHLGCSNGGRQGLVAAQKLPLLFDGIIAGDPSLGFSRIALGEVWNIGVVAKISPLDPDGRPILARAFSDADLKRVRDAVLKRCDAHDGLVDNLIHDWQRCEFDPAELSCKGAKATDCLSTPQVTALRQLFQGPLTKSGR